MNMRRWQKHILFWVVVFFIWMYMKNFSICFDKPSLLINIVQIGSYMAIYYAIREILIPKYFDHGRLWIFGLAVLGWTLVVLFSWNALMGAIVGYYEIHPFAIPGSYGAYILEAVQMFVPGMILLAWESYEDAQKEETRLHIVEKERITTELNYLKSKVNPQFIFNTLKNLKTLVREKSNKAPDMILRLSEVLDYVLYRSQQSSVNLKEEVDVIKGFLELEKLRLGNKLDVTLRTEGDMSIEISPLILLSFVEHALKENILCQSDHLIVDILIDTEFKNVNCDISIKDKNELKIYSYELADFIRQLLLTYPNRHNLSQNEVNGAIVSSLSLITAL